MIASLRNISGLLTFNKVAEKMIAELMIADIMKNLDISQYANQKGVVTTALSDQDDQ